MKIDVIGDIHGELPALNALGKQLGYAVERDWEHADGRIPVFLGDLVDRGEHSLEVAKLVQRLVESGRAACIMGNHEYNLVAHHLQVPGYKRPKRSNRPTIESMKDAREDWDRVLSFLRDLPIALLLPDLRIIHACWHVPSYAAVKDLLEPKGLSAAGGALREYVALESPFTATGMKDGLEPWDAEKKVDSPHELLMKGFELPVSPPFKDSEGTLRDMKRATWWLDSDDLVLRDRPTVVGHYWNLPPVDGDFCPPHPSGHPDLKAWSARLMKSVPPSGEVGAKGNVFCVDFNGVTATQDNGDRACVGALRWPERRIVWASGKRTRTAFEHE